MAEDDEALKHNGAPTWKDPQCHSHHIKPPNNQEHWADQKTHTYHVMALTYYGHRSNTVTKNIEAPRKMEKTPTNVAGGRGSEAGPLRVTLHI